jgi:replicative DNA helicase
MNAPVTIRDPYVDDRFENEAMLIGGLLTYGPSAYRAAAAIIEPEHFVDPFNMVLYDLIGQAIDANLEGFQRVHWIIAQLRESPIVKELKVTAQQLIARYIAQAAPEIATEGCARQMRHDYLAVQLRIAVNTADTASAETHAAEMERLSKAHLTKDDGIQTIGALTNQTLEKLNTALMAGAAHKDYAYCGSLDLGNVIGGWRRKRLYVVAGRPGMGKSTLALSLLLRTARKGHGVMIFALEMGRDELTEMALCNMAYDPRRRIEYRDINASAVMREGFREKFEQVLEAAPRLQQLPLMISDRGGLTLAEIRSQAMQYAQRLAAEGKRLEVIAVDHLGLMKASSRYAGNKVSETEEISSGLKMLAKELDCAVVALAQLSRGVESRDDKRPGLSDLRWSGAIEQDADVVMFVYREAYYLERVKHDDIEEDDRREAKLGELRSKIEAIVAKNRGGPCNVVQMFCDMGCGVVRDLDTVYG